MVDLKIKLPEANKRWNLADQAFPSLREVRHSLLDYEAR